MAQTRIYAWIGFLTTFLMALDTYTQLFLFFCLLHNFDYDVVEVQIDINQQAKPSQANSLNDDGMLRYVVLYFLMSAITW